MVGWGLIAIAAYGLLFLAGVTRPGSIERSLLPVFQFVWAVLMLGGAGTALLGLYWPGTSEFNGARVKIAGLLGAGGGCMAYGSGLLLFGTQAGRGIGVWTLLVGISCWHRALQVHRILRERVPVAEEIDRRRR